MTPTILRIGIYAPYLNTFGGGERYVGKIAEFLSQMHRVDFLTIEPVDIAELQARLSLDLSRVQMVPVVNQVTSNFGPLSAFVRKWTQIRAVSGATQAYDIFFNQETLTAIPNRSRRGIVICQIPPNTFNPSTSILYNLIRVLMTKLLFDPKLRSYEAVLVYSQFVGRSAQKYYDKPITILHPPVDTHQLTPLKKKKMILSVGRFFTGIHNKKQIEMIKIFKMLHDEGELFQDWEYHLVGSIDSNMQAQEFSRRCEIEAQGYPVFLHFNAPFRELQTLYGNASIFWHGAGMNEDEFRHPERAEHFGITTVEAMAAGCVPVVINKGGQPEIVRHAIDGFCWNTIPELINYTKILIADESKRSSLAYAARLRSHDFGIAQFEKNLNRILNLS